MKLPVRDVYGVSDDTLFPLQAALVYELGQTLFVAPNILLVEGPSDLIYLHLLSKAVEAEGGDGLDERWVIAPVGGIDKMATFVSLFGANQLNTAALIDKNRAQHKQRIANLLKAGKLDKKDIIEVSKFVSGADADIEDLFDEAFYLQLLQGSYPGTQAAAITEAMLAADGDPRVVRKVERILEKFGMPNFSHLVPAQYFEREQETLLPQLSDDTIERAKKLFDALNKRLNN